MEKNIARVKENEARLDEIKETISRLDEVLNELDETREKMIALFNYYGSAEWHEDRDLDLPADIKAGVLSEDSVYDAISDLRDEAFRMIETATDILKNRI